MPGGNIFHEPLSWPFVEDGDSLRDSASRWGVESGIPHVLLGGASARRGGGVSGIGVGGVSSGGVSIAISGARSANSISRTSGAVERLG